MKTRFGLALAIATLCGCNSVVIQKAKLQPIHTVAFISLYASHRMLEVRGEGAIRKMDAEGRLQIAEDAYKAFENAWNWLGWEVVPRSDVAQSTAYPYFRRPPAPEVAQGRAADAFQNRLFVPENLAPIWVGEDLQKYERRGRRLATSDRDAIQDILKEVDADAALTVSLRYCFRTFERDRREQVLVTATSGMQIVDRKGEVLYEISKPTDCGGSDHGESQASMPIDSRDWVYDPFQRENIRRLFREASQAEAYRLVASLPVTPRPRKGER